MLGRAVPRPVLHVVPNLDCFFRAPANLVPNPPLLVGQIADHRRHGEVAPRQLIGRHLAGYSPKHLDLKWLSQVQCPTYPIRKKETQL